jgi:hypothetical protein
LTEPEFLIGWDALVDAFREPYGADKKANGRMFRISYDKIKRFDQKTWRLAIDQLLQDYDGRMFPNLKTIMAYVYDAVESTRVVEDPPEIIEMKRIDDEIRHMPDDDRKALFAIAKERAEEEIEKYVGPLPDAVIVQGKMSTELLLSNEFVSKALYKIHCRQVWREMQRTEYGKTGSPF